MQQDQNPPGGARTMAAIFFLLLPIYFGFLGIFLYEFDWPLVRFSLINLSIIFRNPWEFPWAAARGLGVAAALVAGLFGLGYWALSGMRAWRRMLPLASERAALALPVAAVPVSLLVLGLGLAGLARPGVYGALIGAVFVAGVPGWVSLWRGRDARGLGRMLKAQPVWALALLCGLLGLALVYSLSPSVESDELRYHLAAPATWLRDGKIHYLPHQAFSNFPMLGEMLFMAAMAAGGEEAAKPVHLAFLPVTMMLIGLLASRIVFIPHSAFRIPYSSMPADGDARAPRSSFLGGAAFAFIPMVPILGAWGFIDLFVTAYFLAFVYLAGRALARPRRASGTLIGLVAGGACSVKYTMVVLLGGLGFFWCAGLFLSRAGRRALPKLASAVCLMTMLCAGPWYGKNAAWTGNPVYPLANSVFEKMRSGPCGEWTAESASFFMAKARNRAGMHLKGPIGKLSEFLTSPFLTTLYPQYFEENPLGPFPLMALLLCLAWMGGGVGKERAGVRKQLAWIVAAALVSWVLWFASYQSNRFLLPTAGLVLALGARAAARWKNVIPYWAGRVLGVAYLLAAVYATLFVATQIMGTNKAGAVAVALGFEERGDFLAHRLNYYNAAQWLGRRARPGERALLVGEYHTMHFKLPVVASDFFDTPQPLPWMRRTKTNDEMLDLLRAEGVRYILLNKAELERYEALYFFPRFEGDAERARFREIWDNPRLKQVYPNAEREKVFVFEISPKQA